MTRPGPGRPLSSEFSVQLGFSFDRSLGRNMMPFKVATLHQDFDYGILVDGPEGSGKSVFAQQIACFLDKDNRIDLDKQICFTPDEVKKAITTLEKGKAIVWDEARRGLNRRRSTQEINLEITDLLAECRQNNLFLVVVMPSFYDMDMNVAVWRTRALVHVWYELDLERLKYNEPLVRGFFRFYNEQGKKNLYTNKILRQRYEYPYLRDQSFEGRFPHHYVVDENKYRAKKRKSEEDYRKKHSQPDMELIGQVLVKLEDAGVLVDGWAAKTATLFGASLRSMTRWRAKARSANTDNERERIIEEVSP